MTKRDKDMADKIRVLIAGSHIIVREGLRALLHADNAIEIIGEASNEIGVLEKALTLCPDIILMDLSISGQNEIQIIQSLKDYDCSTRIIVFTNIDDEDSILTAIKAGVPGYLPVDSTAKDILEAIHRVHNNELSLPSAVTRRLVQMLHQPAKVVPSYRHCLTDREVDVLKLVAKGLSNQEIADEMIISERTVRTHVSNILGKLQLVNRTQAALYALRDGMASLEDIHIRH